MNDSSIVSPFRDAGHAHARCLRVALDRAESACRTRGVRLTSLRRRVLELVWGSHEPVKAYDILDRLRSERRGAAPPTVYRALDFLLEEGFVHRLESRNAYVGCGAPGHRGTGQFLICVACGAVAEIDDREIVGMLSEKAGELGFAIQDPTIEISGLCARCAGDG